MGTSTARNGSALEKVTVRSFKITQSWLDRFTRVAAARERTVTQQMRWLIYRDVEAFEAAEAEEAAS